VQKRVGIFLLGFLWFLSPARAEREVGCKGALSVASEHLYPNVLGLEFDDIFNSQYGLASKSLRAIFDFLEIQGPRKSTEASLLLSAFLQRLYDTPTVVDRYYPDAHYSAPERALKAEVLETLHLRIYILSRVLEARPLKGDVRLLAKLLETLVGDFNPTRGFLKIPDALLSEKLRLSRENFIAEKSSEAKEDFDSSPFQRSDPVRENEPVVELFYLPGEDKGIVERTMSSMSRESYKNAREKSEYANFDEFAESMIYSYHLIHSRSGNGRILINVYNRALEFLVREVVVPKDSLSHQAKGARTKNFLIQLRKALDGTLAPRFGERFAGMALEGLHAELVNLRYHLNFCSNARELIKDAESLQELNTIFQIAELDEFRIP